MEIPQASERTLALDSRTYTRSLIDTLTDNVEFQSPIDYTQDLRYLPESVSPRYPGYINYDKTPYAIEILECFDIRSPVREVGIKKGVQIAITTILESIVFYFVGQVRTQPAMYVTADLGLSSARIKNNFIPMFRYSGMSDIFRSSDFTNTRKQGITNEQFQWIGGGYMLPYGAQSAAKARQATIVLMLMDELDGWPIEYIKDGDPIRLFKDRCSGVWPIRKIFMGSTPLLKGSSHIDKQYKRGDQRIYKCRCLKCGYPQPLRWSPPPSYTGEPWGMVWEYLEGGELDVTSVRYVCANCHHGHEEHDKPKFINKANCYWEPTATPVEPNIRSYHIPAMLSPVGMQPWSKCVTTWLDAWDPKTRRVKDHAAMRVFYNNILGESYDISGARVTFRMASAHRRMFYSKGQIPNRHVVKYCRSEIVLLTCTVDVHHENLAVAVWGWTVGMGCWLVDYFRIHDDSEEGCEDSNSPAWDELRELIDDGMWADEDGDAYNIKITLIDSQWATSTVVKFCSEYASGVYPIQGRPGTRKSTSIKEFAEFTTQIGTTGYGIYVDYYKDRISPVLRRTWRPEVGLQEPYTFNAPIDTTDEELKELTREKKIEKESPSGVRTYEWHRPHNARNELWDLMVYGHASVEIVAWDYCIKTFKLESIDWNWFWEHLRQLLGTNKVRKD